jgi:hypothetical protein
MMGINTDSFPACERLDSSKRNHLRLQPHFLHFSVYIFFQLVHDPLINLAGEVVETLQPFD